MYKRGNSWVTNFYHKGVRYQKFWRGVSKTNAKDKEASYKAAVFAGKDVQKEKLTTFDDIAAKYLKYARTNKKPQAARRNGSSIKMLSDHFAGTLTRSGRKSSLLRQMRNYRVRARKKPPLSQSGARCGWKGALTSAKSWRWAGAGRLRQSSSGASR